MLPGFNNQITIVATLSMYWVENRGLGYRIVQTHRIRRKKLNYQQELNKVTSRPSKANAVNASPSSKRM